MGNSRFKTIEVGNIDFYLSKCEKLGQKSRQVSTQTVRCMGWSI